MPLKRRIYSASAIRVNACDNKHVSLKFFLKMIFSVISEALLSLGHGNVN